MLWTDLFVLYYLTEFFDPIKVNAKNLFRRCLVPNQDVVVVEGLFYHEWADPWICQFKINCGAR